MSIDRIDLNEFSPTDASRAEVREKLDAILLEPRQMLEVAKGMAEGAELLGTNLEVSIGRKRNNPEKFAVDFSAISVPETDGAEADGPNHEGHAKIYVPTEGGQSLSEFTERFVGQWLKLEKKGYQAGISENVTETKAGKLSAASRDRLDRATSSLVWELTEQLAAKRAGVDGYKSELFDRRAEQVKAWIGCTDEEAQAVLGSMTGHIASFLGGVIEED